MGKDARWLAGYTTKNYGVPLCAECAQKRKTANTAETAQNEQGGGKPAEPEQTPTEVETPAEVNESAEDEGEVL
jgi:hypothetical protein